MAAATACLGAVVAYAATRSQGGHKQGNRAQHRERLLRPELLEAPPETTAAGDPQLRFHVRPRKPPTPPPPDVPEPAEPEASTRRFQCRLDGGGWEACRSPYRPTGLAPGSHRFAVRVFNYEGRVGEPTAASWLQIPAAAPDPPPAPPPPHDETLEPMRFSIEALAEPENLYPGFPPTAIPVRITNPNPVPIEVTALSVAIGEAPAACAAGNFELTPAGLSPTAPVPVPAGGAVELPTAGAAAPAIQMLNLPVNQDACQELRIPLVFSGEAQG